MFEDLALYVGVFTAFWFVGVYLANIWIDYTDGLTERLNDTLERELTEYGASEGSDGRHA